MKLTGENRSTRGKTCRSATLSTTNPTWTDPGSKPGLRGAYYMSPWILSTRIYVFLMVVTISKGHLIHDVISLCNWDVVFSLWGMKQFFKVLFSERRVWNDWAVSVCWNCWSRGGMLKRTEHTVMDAGIRAVSVTEFVARGTFVEDWASR
jgi:hypothetical protein